MELVCGEGTAEPPLLAYKFVIKQLALIGVSERSLGLHKENYQCLQPDCL